MCVSSPCAPDQIWYSVSLQTSNFESLQLKHASYQTDVWCHNNCWQKPTSLFLKFNFCDLIHSVAPLLWGDKNRCQCCCDLDLGHVLIWADKKPSRTCSEHVTCMAHHDFGIYSVQTINQHLAWLTKLMCTLMWPETPYKLFWHNSIPFFANYIECVDPKLSLSPAHQIWQRSLSSNDLNHALSGKPLAISLCEGMQFIAKCILTSKHSDFSYSTPKNYFF